MVAASTLATAALLARTGHYTNDVVSFTPTSLHAHTDAALAQLGPPALVLLAGVLAFRPRVRLGGDPLVWGLLIGGAGYLANMLPWRTDAYYAGPYLYLLTLGCLLALRDIGPSDGTAGDGMAGDGTAGDNAATDGGWPVVRWFGVLAVPLLVAVEVAASSLLGGWYTNANVTGLRDCVLRLPAGSVVGFNRVEGWLRLDGIIRRHDPQWTGKVVLVRDGLTTGEVWSQRVDHVDYYIHQGSYGPGTPALMTGPVVCRTKQSIMYQVRS